MGAGVAGVTGALAHKPVVAGFKIEHGHALTQSLQEREITAPRAPMWMEQRVRHAMLRPVLNVSYFFLHII